MIADLPRPGHRAHDSEPGRRFSRSIHRRHRVDVSVRRRDQECIASFPRSGGSRDCGRTRPLSVADAGVLRGEVVLVASKRDGRFTSMSGSSTASPKRSARRSGTACTCRTTMVRTGPSCLPARRYSIDVLYEQHTYELPLALAPGDNVDFLSTGAYTTTYSTVGFNGLPPLARITSPSTGAPPACSCRPMPVHWPLLDALPEPDRRALISERAPPLRPPGSDLPRGDPGDALHLVERGHVAIRINTPLGDVATVQVVCAGEFLRTRRRRLRHRGTRPQSPSMRSRRSRSTGGLLDELRTQHAGDRSPAGGARRGGAAARDAGCRVHVRAGGGGCGGGVFAISRATFGSGAEPAKEIPLTQELIAQLTGCTPDGRLAAAPAARTTGSSGFRGAV